MRAESEASYGSVLHLAVDTENDEGNVYVKFADIDGGKKAIHGLNGRFFGGRMLSAAPVVDAIYNTRFPGA